MGAGRPPKIYKQTSTVAYISLFYPLNTPTHFLETEASFLSLIACAAVFFSLLPLLFTSTLTERRSMTTKAQDRGRMYLQPLWALEKRPQKHSFDSAPGLK